MMKKFSIAVIALASISMLSVVFVVGCTFEKDGGVYRIYPTDSGKPRTLPPSKYKRVIIDGECWIQFKTPKGWYCIPCDAEEGFAVGCDEVIRGTAGIGGFGYDITFNRFVSEILAQEGIERNGQAILSAYGYDTWQSGDIANVPIAMERLDTGRNSISVYVISRSDWEWPDNGSGSQLAGLFFGDPTDNTPDAAIFRVRGTFEEVTDSLGAMFIDGFTWQGTFDGYNIDVEIFPIGEGLYQGLFFLDGELVWQRRE